MKRHPPRSTRTATLSPYTPLFRSLDKEQTDGLVVQVGSPREADYDTIALTFGLSPFYCGQTWAHGRFAASVIIQAAMAVSAGLETRVGCLMAMKNSDIGRMGEADNPFYYEQFRENDGRNGEEGDIRQDTPTEGEGKTGRR